MRKDIVTTELDVKIQQESQRIHLNEDWSAGKLRCSNRYIDEFLRLGCAPELIELKLFPTAKEITESMAAFQAVINYIPEISLKDPDINLISIGDGVSPRTSGLFAFRSKLNCVSVDPQLRVEKYSGLIKRVSLIKTRAENLNIECDTAIIVAVHSHANLEKSAAKIKAKRKFVIAIPCCKPQLMGAINPTIVYVDDGIHSPCRAIYIWKNV